MVTNDFLLHLRLLSSTTFSHHSSNNLPSFRSVYRPDPPDRPQSTAGIEKKKMYGRRATTGLDCHPHLISGFHILKSLPHPFPIFSWPFSFCLGPFSALNPYPVPITIPFVLNDLDRVVSILFVSKIQTSRASAWESFDFLYSSFLSLRTSLPFSIFLVEP